MTASVRLALLRDVRFRDVRKPLKNLRTGPTHRNARHFGIQPKYSATISDPHFRAFLLITQARFMVKTNSNDSLERKQTCVTFSGISFQVSGVTRGGDVAQLAIE